MTTLLELSWLDEGGYDREQMLHVIAPSYVVDVGIVGYHSRRPAAYQEEYGHHCILGIPLSARS